MSALIDSILNNYFIPPLVFAIREVKEKNTRVCIDGKQRLTAIYMFMNNDFPYVDMSTGIPIEYYFKQSTDNVNIQAMKRTNERQILPSEAVDHFNAHEFVCMEYSDLNEDAEYEIFARVQMGVSITTAEKLRANNSVVSKQINALTEEFWKLGTIFDDKNTASIFQAIAQIILTLKHAPHDFKLHMKELKLLISGNDELSTATIESTKKVLKKLIEMSEDANCVAAFSLNTTTRKKDFLRRIELLCFCTYLHMIGCNRTLFELAMDCRQMRTFMQTNLADGMYIGRKQFLSTMEWINGKINEIRLNELEQERLIRLTQGQCEVPKRKRSSRVAPKTIIEDDELDQLDYNLDNQTPTPTVILATRPKRMVPSLAKRGRSRR
ncbi:unnamed protein product [Rhizopus stolonifer]